jgi:hypothetical protein
MKSILVITSIANQEHPIINKIATESTIHGIPFIMIGDTKSPQSFNVAGCDFYSVERQQELEFEIAKILPTKHYSRKNIGYLVAMLKGAEIIIETDDDNIPLDGFWNKRTRTVSAHHLANKGWVNIYNYYTNLPIWPRGFALDHIRDKAPELETPISIDCPIQQGLANENPDVDAIYRLTFPLPINFEKKDNIALGAGTFCPFNSQNTTWFKEAFPLMYLPSYCSFRMTDIWRSFVAQRIAWTCGWAVLFHSSTVWQERNDHDLMKDFRDEIPGFINNNIIYDSLIDIKMKEGVEHIPENMLLCYKKLIDLQLIDMKELKLLDAWLKDCII